MKRTALTFAALAVLATVLFLARRDAVFAPGMRADTSLDTSADSAWYHASDVALLATTGRPQLVEFFHPN